MKRVLVLAVVLALLAPALAVCAGTSEPVQARANHDCCPKEEINAAMTAPSPASMAESCCRMSDEAGQRAASPVSPQIVALQTSIEVPAWLHAVPSNTPASDVHTAPVSVDPIPRHLLLSVLIV